MTIQSEPLPGAIVLQPKIFRDQRGEFVKTYHEGIFSELGLPVQWTEEFHSVSRRGVIRGMHFQTPPADHCKLVYCLRGRVLDVILDLRRNSPAYGKWASIELCPEKCLQFFIPKGFAHGFLALEEDSLMVYKTTTVHSPENDAGIRWDSFGFAWPCSAPIVSERDASFPELNQYDTPFT